MATGKNVGSLGPSDSSDSGSDVQGERPMATEPDNAAEWGAVPAKPDTGTDASGTGERASATGDGPTDAPDIEPDRIERFRPETEDTSIDDAIDSEAPRRP